MSDLNFRYGGRDLNSPEAGNAPTREVLPKGKYVCKIVDIKAGLTKQTPPQPKMVVEFMVLTDESGSRAMSGKRVFQDYMLNPEVRGDGNDFQTYRLRGLLSACQVPVVSNQFDAQPMIGQDVLVTVTHRFGNPGPDGKIPTFTNVETVDRVAGAGDAGDIL
jgi:hypothetical protein